MLVYAAFSRDAGVSDVGALLEAARRGDTAQVTSPLEHKAEVDVPSADGSALLLRIITNDHLVIARQLTETGTDVNRQNSRFDSPCLLANVEGRLEILRLTLLHGADPKSVNHYDGIALIPACERGHVEVVKTLLQAGIDPNHVDELGWTGLLRAVLLSDGGSCHQKIVCLPAGAGADVSLADVDGVSPLTHAHRRGQGGIERLLLTAGV